MRFGVSIEAPIEWPELLSVARELDRETRYEFLWIADSLVANGALDEPRLEAWTLLAALAEATSRLRLGVLVSANPFRHPALVAKMATTLDHVSQGRIELGLGAGWAGQNRRYGFDFWNRAERHARFDEAVQVIKRLWTEPRPRLEGEYYRLEEPPYSPKNVQRPHPPILIGGGHEPMLRTIARWADAANPMIDMREARERVGAFCEEYGRDPATLRWTQEIQLFLNDDRGMQVRALEWASREHGMSEERVREGSLFGSLEEVRAKVERQREAGAEELYLFQLPRVHRKSLIRFSDEIIPTFL